MKLIILNFILLATAIPSLRGELETTTETCGYTYPISWYSIVGPDEQAEKIPTPPLAVRTFPPFNFNRNGITFNIEQYTTLGGILSTTTFLKVNDQFSLAAGIFTPGTEKAECTNNPQFILELYDDDDLYSLGIGTSFTTCEPLPDSNSIVGTPLIIDEGDIKIEIVEWSNTDAYGLHVCFGIDNIFVLGFQSTSSD